MKKLVVILNTSSWDSERAARAASANLPIVGRNRSKEDWMFEVPFADDQSIIGFPKFGTFGVSFSNGDTSTNFPFATDSRKILDHIRASSAVPFEDEGALAAIELLQTALPWICAEYGMECPSYDPRLDTLFRYRKKGLVL